MVFDIFFGCPVAVSCLVVNDDTRLHIVDKLCEFNSFAFVLYRISLHKNASTDKLISHKLRRHAVHDVIAGLADIFCHLIFIRQHSCDVHISRSGREVLFIRVFGTQLERDEMASIIAVLIFDKVRVFDSMPARGLHHPDRAALSGWHRIF